jgi:hypothetical protein
MAILTFGELIAWAQTNCPEEYARLPDPDIYEITCINACVKVCVGVIARTAVYQDLISFENNMLKVRVHLDYSTGALILLAGDNMRLTPSFYSQIQLTEPFCWIWPSLSTSLGLAKFNALVRYALMARGHDGRLADMSFGIQEVFPQICADIARGQDVKNMKSVWEAGQRTDQELRDDHSKSEDENDLADAHSTKESLEGQQKCGVTVSTSNSHAQPFLLKLCSSTTAYNTCRKSSKFSKHATG